MSTSSRNRFSSISGYRAKRARAVTALVFAAGVAQSAAADTHSWNTGNGVWSTGGNWSPVGMPFPADTARIGNLAGIANNTVTLNVNATVTALEILDGMTLRMTNRSLSVAGLTDVSGQNTVGQTSFPSTLRIEPGGGFYAYSTDDLLIRNGARVTMEGGVGALVEGTATLQSGGVLSGRGNIDFSGDSGAVLVNDGEIRVGAGGMVLRSTHDGRLDLDGGNGAGTVIVDTQDANALQVIDAGLADSFGGDIHITSNSQLIMLLSEGWTADANSSITVEGIIDLQPRPAARISGSPTTLAGLLSVEGFSGHLKFDAVATLQPTLEVMIGSNDRAEFGPTATINGGVYTLAQGAQLDFNGPAILNGGTFNTFGVEDADGDVDFNGATTWAGNVTINGRAQQNGPATVSATTVITADLFDISGETDHANWTINAPLVINTDDTRTNPLDFYRGVMTIGGSVTNKLTLNLTGTIQEAWSMYGEMNLSGNSLFFVNRLAGSIVLGSGIFNIDDNKVEISADMIFMPSGTVNFEGPNSALRMRGKTTVRDAMTFNGEGTLLNGVGGVMVLQDGLTLGDAGLANQGDLSISRFGSPEQPGLVSVDRFTNDAQGTWHVRIGGQVAGDEHDAILVSGGSATLGGTLEVSLCDLGLGLLAPSIGNEFTILNALGGVSGTFLSNPSTVTPAGTYKWTVLYQPNTVVLKLANFIPAPCYANCDGSTLAPVLNVNDFTCFLNRFAAGDSYANCDQSTLAPTLNVNDFSCFLNRYATGCP